MSQWGAHDAAAKGIGYQRILEFYPHTKLAAAGGALRVNITGDTTRDVVVLDRAGLTLKALASGRTWKPRVAAQRWRILPVSGGRSVVSYQTGRWHTWKTFRGQAEFSAGSKPLTLVKPGGNIAYRGTLRSAIVDSRPATVNVVSLDSYVKGVVPQEVPAEWPTPLGACPGRRRPHVRRLPARGPHRPDLRGHHLLPGVRRLLRRAPRLQRRGRRDPRPGPHLPGQARLHGVLRGSNGGWTVRGQVHGANVPYLPARQDPYDHAYRRWTATFTGNEIARHFAGLGTFDNIAVTERDGNGAGNGRAVQVRVTDTNGTSRTADADDFMLWIGLRSTWFANPVVRR